MKTSVKIFFQWSFPPTERSLAFVRAVVGKCFFQPSSKHCVTDVDKSGKFWKPKDAGISFVSCFSLTCSPPQSSRFSPFITRHKENKTKNKPGPAKNFFYINKLRIFFREIIYKTIKTSCDADAVSNILKNVSRFCVCCERLAANRKTRLNFSRKNSLEFITD